jgi:hypothetical protein
MRLIVSALVASTVLGGCASSSGATTPTATSAPATVPPPTSIPGRPGVEEIMGMFDQAVINRAMTSARGFLTPSLARTTPPMTLAADLGLRNVPVTATYTIVSSGRDRAVVDVTYGLAHGKVRDRLSLVRAADGWRIAAIRHLT